MANEKLIQRIYTDGACSGNPGPGGWGTVIYFSDGSVHELGGGEAQTTNNRMEMQAAIRALEFLLTVDQTEAVALYTDSEYVKNGITQWLTGWKKKGWKTAAGKPVLNQDLWRVLDMLQAQTLDRLPLQWRYVKGHSGDPGNDRCDEIARSFSLGKTPALRQTVVPDTAIAQISPETIQSSQTSAVVNNDSDMVDSANLEVSEVPREVKVVQLRHVVETLHMADEIARQGYLITSSELADLMDVNASAVTSRGDNWVWRNWVISRVRREGNQILWQLERVD
jgi:ribonuclease HI